MGRACIFGILSFALGVGASLAGLEGLLRVLPVDRGAYGAEPDSNWPAHHLAPNADYVFSTGWDMEDVQRGRTNNMGYVAPFDYVPGTAGVFVVGDSYIEDQMNPYQDSLQGVLPTLLDTKMPVLGFGTAGGNLAHDLGVAGLIGKEFKPIWAVVLITRQNFIHGFNHTPGYFAWDVQSPSLVQLVPERRHGQLASLVRGLALVSYARSNLRADWSTLLAQRKWEAERSCTPGILSELDKRLLQSVTEQLPSEFGIRASRVILIFDADHDAIYREDDQAPPDACPTRDSLALSYLAARAVETGMKVIDMGPVLRADYRSTGRHFDYLPVDAHWNGVAHELAAREVARYINQVVR